MARSKKTLKYWGIAVQVLTYVANGMLWCLAVYASGFAVVIGLSSGTISTEDGDILDFIVLTPATVFLFYGLPLLAVATFGCFATVSANYIAVIIASDHKEIFLLIGLYTVYDVAFAISLMGGGGAYDKFIASLKQSQYSYSDPDADGVGVIPVHPKIYWDHLQRRGKCCGLYSYLDWKNTTMAKEFFSIPDSCCNELYDYAGCGQLVWKHPDHEMHTIESIIFQRGCLTIFPTFIQSDEDESILHLGRFLVAMLFISLITAIALFLLVISRAFRTPTGLNNPDFIDVPADPSLMLATRRDQVHPGPDSRGDRDNANVDDDDDLRQRKISFDDKGPTLISERERQQTPQRERQRNNALPDREENRQRNNRNRRDW